MGTDLLNWDDEKTSIFLNPRIPLSERQDLENQALKCDFHSHIWLSTSGTTGTKLVALAKSALLTSAREVNRVLNATAKDAWLLSLPTFHVGGLSILARAHLLGAKVHPFYPWHIEGFKEALAGISFLSLVPTQAFDLVQANIAPPKSLKAVFIGGDRLDESLALKAKRLGWPIIPTYGMTECASQVASGSPLTLLPHMQVRVNNQKLSIKSDSLLTGYIKNGTFFDPKVDGWFETEDLAEVHGDVLSIHGRVGEVVKILGEIVSVPLLREKLRSLGAEKHHLVAIEHERRGVELVLKTDAPEAAVGLVEAFNASVLPFQRIQRIERTSIHKTELGKIIY